MAASSNAAAAAAAGAWPKASDDLDPQAAGVPIASRPDAWNPVTMPACRFGGRRRSSRLRLALAARPTARAPPTSPLLLLLLLLRVRAQRTLAARRGGAGDERSIYAGTPRRTGLYAILAERTTPPPLPSLTNLRRAARERWCTLTRARSAPRTTRARSSRRRCGERGERAQTARRD